MVVSSWLGVFTFKDAILDVENEVNEVRAETPNSRASNAICPGRRDRPYSITGLHSECRALRTRHLKKEQTFPCTRVPHTQAISCGEGGIESGVVGYWYPESEHVECSYECESGGV